VGHCLCTADGPVEAIHVSNGRATGQTGLSREFKPAEAVHREYVCADGNDAGAGDGGATLPLSFGGRASGGAAGVDYAAAAARDPRGSRGAIAEDPLS
jgi:hypothetical protein